MAMIKGCRLFYREPILPLRPIEERVLRVLMGNTGLSIYNIHRVLCQITMGRVSLIDIEVAIESLLTKRMIYQVVADRHMTRYGININGTQALHELRLEAERLEQWTI